MPMDDFSEFEAEMEGIDNPSVLEVTDHQHNGQEVFRLMSELSSLICDDIILALNEGRIGLVSYSSQGNGTSIVALLQDKRNLLIKVQLPPESMFFAVEPQ